MDKIKEILKKIGVWFKNHNIYSRKFYKKNGRIYSWIAKFATSFVAFLIILVLAVVIVGNVYLNKIDKHVIDKDTDLGISQEAEQLYTDSGVVNIMLYGIDSRDMKEEARSDAIMLLTIDRDRCKIKMTSIARDTYVNIPGYGYDKLNHAFVYGWHKTGNVVDGAVLSMNTIKAEPSSGFQKTESSFLQLSAIFRAVNTPCIPTM
jgi:anionic cell wall polymer biosynthesis LytR-Cps2A-Psr (LCP) family protein